MQISSRLSIAVHAILTIEYFKEKGKVTSDFISSSVQVNPVIVRRILSQLREAGIVSSSQGVAGFHLAKDPKEITLLDVYNSVECTKAEGLFRFHENPNTDCPVGKQIHAVLDERYAKAQNAFLNSLQQATIADMLAEIQ